MKEIVKTYLPKFDGFYETSHEFSYDSIIEEIRYYKETHDNEKEISIDDLDIDFKGFYTAYAKEACDCIEQKLKDLKIISSISFEKVVSPKFYNSSNDNINIAAEFSEENKNNIKDYIENNFSDFEEYVKNHFTSCSGFISFFSNDVNFWKNNYIIPWVEKGEDFDHSRKSTIIGILLDFVLDNEETYTNETTEDIVDYCHDVYETDYILNYNEIFPEND